METEMTDDVASIDIFKDAMVDLSSAPDAVHFDAFPELMEATNGFRMHELSLICAPTGSGKTQMLANFASDLMKQSIPHLVASVETGPRDFLVRAISSLDQKDWNDGEQKTKEEIFYLIDAYKKFFTENIRYALFENRVSVDRLVKLIERNSKLYGTRIAFLDNLNFFLEIKPDNYEKAEMDHAIHELVMLVKRVPIHIMLVVHPRKTDGGIVKSEFDIKGSSTAVQEAHNVFLFNRISEDDQIQWNLEPFDRILSIRKLRKRGRYVGKEIVFGFRNGRYHSKGWMPYRRTR